MQPCRSGLPRAGQTCPESLRELKTCPANNPQRNRWWPGSVHRMVPIVRLKIPVARHPAAVFAKGVVRFPRRMPSWGRDLDRRGSVHAVEGCNAGPASEAVRRASSTCPHTRGGHRAWPQCRLTPCVHRRTLGISTVSGRRDRSCSLGPSSTRLLTHAADSGGKSRLETGLGRKVCPMLHFRREANRLDGTDSARTPAV